MCDDGGIVIASTSDLHGLLDGISEVCRHNKVDVLCVAGDIEPADIFTSKPYWFERKFFPFIGTLPCEVVAIPGNHDFYLSAHYQTIKNGDDKSVPMNFHLIIDEDIEICGHKFYGTPWVPYINGGWCFEGEDEDLSDNFSMIPEDVDVLIAHSPPMIPHEKIDVSCDHPIGSQKHFGSKSLTKAINVKCPRIVFCGHIHSGDHSPLSITNSKEGTGLKETQVFNVSRVNERYNIAYGIRVSKFGSDGSFADYRTGLYE